MSDQEYHDIIDATQIPLVKVLKIKYDFKISNIFHIAICFINNFKLPFFLGVAVLFFYSLIFQAILEIFAPFYFISLGLLFLDLVLASILYIGFNTLTLKHLSGEEINFQKDFFASFNYFKKLFAAFCIRSIIISLIVILTSFIFYTIYLSSESLGLAIMLVILVIMLIIYLLVSWCLTEWIIIDYPDNSVFQCILVSMKVVNQHFFKFCFLFTLLAFINMLAAIPFGIGLIWSLPFSTLTIGILYKSIFYTIEEQY